MPDFHLISKAGLEDERTRQRQRELRLEQTLADLADRTDKEWEMNFQIISKNRTSLGFKPFVSVKENKVRIWWWLSEQYGVTAIKPVNLDTSNTTYRVTLLFKQVLPSEQLTRVINSFSGDGWITCPYEKYVKIPEKVSIKLPYRIKFPKVNSELNRLKKSGAKWKGFEFEIAFDSEGHSESDLDRDSNGLL